MQCSFPRHFVNDVALKIATTKFSAVVTKLLIVDICRGSGYNPGKYFLKTYAEEIK